MTLRSGIERFVVAVQELKEARRIGLSSCESRARCCSAEPPRFSSEFGWHA
jgi:hypothetical protein